MIARSESKAGSLIRTPDGPLEGFDNDNDDDEDDEDDEDEDDEDDDGGDDDPNESEPIGPPTITHVSRHWRDMQAIVPQQWG